MTPSLTKDSAPMQAIQAALIRARELGAMEMDWIGTGSDQRYANKQEREYLALIDAGIEALAALRASSAPKGST